MIMSVYAGFITDRFQMHRPFSLSLIRWRVGQAIKRLKVYPLLILLLSGCASTVPQIVKIPVNTPCIEADKAPKMPAITDDKTLAGYDDFKLVITLATERLELKQYATEAAAVITACSR